MNIRTLLFPLLFLVCTLTNVSAQTVTRVPRSKQAVMIDGKISKGEWDDAARMTLSNATLGEFARVYIKQSNDHVWLALEILKSDTGTLDLYLSTGSAPLANFHASAKLGQRIAQDGHFPEEWTWWNNEGWVANVSRVDSFEKRSFLPENVREYQIARSWFPANDFRLMFDIMTKAEPKWTPTVFPEQARNNNPQNWFRFRLD